MGTNSLLVAVAILALGARSGAAQHAQSSIMISATIAAPVDGMAPDALAPRLGAQAARPLASERARSTATSMSAAAARYRVRLVLDPSSDAPAARVLFVRDADDRERSLEVGRGVTIVRRATAAEAAGAVVRLRVGEGSAPHGGTRDVHLVYVVTSESALTM